MEFDSVIIEQVNGLSYLHISRTTRPCLHIGSRTGSDLEFNYINPYDSSSHINAVIIPVFLIQGALCAVFLLNWHWFHFLIMAPITYYHVNLYRRRRHLIDVTEIFSSLNAEKKYRLVKLAFYLSLFLITIYRLVMSAVIALINDEGVVFESGIY